MVGGSVPRLWDDARAQVQAHHEHDGHESCSMFPANNLRYPEGTGSRYMNYQLFTQILNRVEAVYRPQFQSRGGRFVIQRDWFNPEVNAYATVEGSQRIIRMFGGLARHPKMTPDAFLAVACHEIGHHLGGAPLKSRLWATSEGGSDYFATTKCMRLILAGQSNDLVVSRMRLDGDAVRACNAAYKDRESVNICLRSVMAGKALATVLSELNGDTNAPQIRTPDLLQVQQTYVEHPAAQCRLDTYLHGALCRESENVPLSSRDIRTGSCDNGYPHPFGQRPRCWFNPLDPRTIGTFGGSAGE